MDKIEIYIRTDMNDLEKMLDKLKQIEISTLSGGDEYILAYHDSVAEVFLNHNKTPVEKPDEIVKCKDCGYSFEFNSMIKCQRNSLDNIKQNDFCSKGVRK